jgi:hypothetical protein
MADPHNVKRYGETWSQVKIDRYLEELVKIKPFVIFSGGWAWHFMSPKNHIELKHAHDHKDVDIFVNYENVTTVIKLLMDNGFKKVPTKYDKLKNNNDFRRYEKVVDDFRVTIDFFIARNISTRIIEGWTVVEPTQLLTFYRSIHTSDNCFAVMAADLLIKRGIDPVGREELVTIPE